MTTMPSEKQETENADPSDVKESNVKEDVDDYDAVVEEEQQAMRQEKGKQQNDEEEETKVPDEESQEEKEQQVMVETETGIVVPTDENSSKAAAVVAVPPLAADGPKQETLPTGSRNRGSSSFHLFLSIVAFCVVIGFAVGLGIGLTNRNDGGKEEEDKDDDDRDDPELLPSTTLDYQELVDYLVENNITSLDVLDENSPQARAARWLVETDTATNNWTLPNITEPREAYEFVSRYVLVTLYFATNGANWLYQFDFLSESNICDWRGIVVTTGGEAIPFGAICDANGLISAIYLDSNNLQGSIPPEVTVLSTLRDFDVNFNYNIGGSLPPGMDKLTLLKLLALSSNEISGTIPSELCALQSLQQLFVGYNQLVGEIPACLGNLTNLQTLFLSNNILSGTLPDTLASQSQLERLWLDDNLLSGDITKMFNSLPFLQLLILEDNFFEAALDENFLADSRLLQELDISTNKLRGPLPAHLFDTEVHPILKLVDLHGNKLTGFLPDIIPVNSNLLFVALYDNLIQGSVPESWASFQELFHLDLSSNLLSGPMPDHLGNMTLLSYLFLANNTFSPGPIPESFAQLTNMKELSLKRTGRVGVLPEWVSDWEDLILLDLDNNNFSGEIPELYGSLTNLEFLLLNRNNIRGTLPATFSAMTNLRAVFLEKNSMTGQLDVLCNLPNFQEAKGDADGTEIIAADCIGLVECSCCSICCVPSFSGATEDEGLQDEDTCHDATKIPNLDPQWEAAYARATFDFGNGTRFIDRAFLDDESSNDVVVSTMVGTPPTVP